jgi:hypothetical protein
MVWPHSSPLRHLAEVGSQLVITCKEITMSKNVRFYTLDDQNMDPARWNEITVLADDVQPNEKLTFNGPTPIATGLTFFDGNATVPFVQVDDTNTYKASTMIQYSGTDTTSVLNVSLDGGATAAIAGGLTINWAPHDDVHGIMVLKSFAVSDTAQTATTLPSDSTKIASAQIQVVTGSTTPVSDVQVAWYTDPSVSFVFLFDDAGAPLTKMPGGSYLTRTDANGIAKIQIAAARPNSCNLRANVIGEDEDASTNIVLASLEYQSIDPYNAPTIPDLSSPEEGSEPGLVIHPGETEFSVRLLPSLPVDTDLFICLNDKTCPLVIASADPLDYTPMQSIKYAYLDFTGREPHYQTMKFYTQEGGTNPKASRTTKFPVYGTYENRPVEPLSRPLPSVVIARDGGIYLDLYTISPKLEFTIPKNGQIMKNVNVTLYLNGYEPGTNNPKTFNQSYSIMALGASSPNIAANTEQALSFKFADVAGYDRDQSGHYRFFYLEYSAEVNGQTLFSKYPRRSMATA